MSDAWAELQAVKSKRDFRKKRLEERKKERQLRQDILRGAPAPLATPSHLHDGESSYAEECLEEVILRTLSDVGLLLPMDSKQLLVTVNKSLASSPAQHNQITNLLQKFAAQLLISIEEKVDDEGTVVEIVSVDHTKLSVMLTVATAGEDCMDSPSGGSVVGGSNLASSRDSGSLAGKKRKSEPGGDESSDEDGQRANTAVSMNATTSPVGGTSSGVLPDEKKVKENDVLSLLSLASTRERENKRIGEEILELLSRPSAKEKTLAERFRSQGGNVVKEFCPHGTKSECRRVSVNSKPCAKLHFRKIIQPHTDETLGDCSFLNTCFHMETCKYVHYEVDSSDSTCVTLRDGNPNSPSNVAVISNKKEGLFGALENTNSNSGLDTVVPDSKSVLFSPQWVFCDLRYFDMTVLGKFSVIMADPPWDIHMELPYGTLSDDEMRHLNIPALQDEGLIFLWVTGRAMELGRECLELWGYERVDELIWVKTNQLQRIIRTGRTGHWLNHGKEHCLVGMKGNPPINRGLDCDVIVAEVRATSHKPDEIYGIIERLSPGTRKIELFGRPHNIQPNWITLGNQLEGSNIVDDEVRARFFARYPDGNCTVIKSK